MTTPTEETIEQPKVFFHPPSVIFAALVSGYILRLFFGGRMPIPRVVAEGVGGLAIIIALGLMIAAVSNFAEEGENLQPATPSKQLFRGGVYKFSRNPIYLAMVMFGAGFGIATSNIWIILTTVIAGLVLHFFVINPEEEYLQYQFGEDYDAYKKQVRRWF